MQICSSPRPFFTRTFVVTCTAILCTMLWGSAFPVIKTGYVLLNITRPSEMLMFAGFRFLIAGTFILLIIKIFNRSNVSLSTNDYLATLLVGIIQVFFQFSFFYIGLANTTGVKASLINGSGSFFVVIFSVIMIPAERVGFKKALGLALGFLGLVLLNINPVDFSFVMNLQGDGMILLTAITGGIGSVVVKRVSPAISPPMLTGYQFINGSLLLLLVGHLTASGNNILYNMTPYLFILVLYLTIVSATAFTLWYTLIKHNNLSRIAVFFFLVPVWGALFSSIFLPGEYLDIALVISLALICSGIYMTMSE